MKRSHSLHRGDVITRSEEIGHRVWGRLVAENPDVPFPVRLPPGPLVS